MSWRRFSVLLRGLGPNSAYVNVLAHEDTGPKVLEGEAAERFFELEMR